MWVAIGSAEIPNIRRSWCFTLIAVIGFRYHAVRDNLPGIYKKACADFGIDPADGSKIEKKKKR